MGERLPPQYCTTKFSVNQPRKGLESQLHPYRAAPLPGLVRTTATTPVGLHHYHRWPVALPLFSRGCQRGVFFFLCRKSWLAAPSPRELTVALWKHWYDFACCNLTIELTIFKYPPSNFKRAKFCYSIHCFKLNNSYRHNLLNDKSTVDSNLLYINIKKQSMFDFLN